MKNLTKTTIGMVTMNKKVYIAAFDDGSISLYIDKFRYALCTGYKTKLSVEHILNFIDTQINGDGKLICKCPKCGRNVVWNQKGVMCLYCIHIFNSEPDIRYDSGCILLINESTIYDQPMLDRLMLLDDYSPKDKFKYPNIAQIYEHAQKKYIRTMSFDAFMEGKEIDL